MPLNLWLVVSVVVILLVILILSNLMWWRLLKQQSLSLTQTPNQLVEKLQQQNQDLLNRMMSQDLPAYQTMTHLKNLSQNSSSDTPYYSQHDLAVIQRLKENGMVAGLGDEIFYQDEEMAGFMQDFGLEPPKSPRGE